MIARYIELFTREMLIYALLSLTVIRMLPVFISLAGTGESLRSQLFLGWFGPRGLASIVFAIIVLEKGVAESQCIATVVAVTVISSLVAHGISANPFARLMGQNDGQ